MTQQEKKELLALTPGELAELLLSIGEPRYRAEQLFVQLHRGLSPEEITCSIRISLSHNNTKEEIDLLADAMSDALGRLVRIHH